MSRRKEIRMSDAEVREFLEASKTIIIVSNGPDGHPHPMPMWYAIDDDGAIRMTTFRASQKVRNLERDPRVALLVESGEEYAQLKGVVIYGRAEILDDIAIVKQTLVDAGTRTGPALGAEARKGMESVMARTASKRVCIRVKPERVVSWDHAKLGGRY
jgi:PPOX class probable F420-dependent enzyme